MSEWKKYKFGDLYSEPSRNGLTKPSAIRGRGYKMVNMKEIFAYDRMVNIPMERVPLTDKEERFILKSGDLLFARQSLVVSGAGKCSIFLHDDEDVVFESHLIRTRFDEKFVLPSFLYYYFRSPIGRNKIESIVEFTAAAGIRGSDLANIEIEIPDLTTQRQIAQILSSLDEKIELNLQMNQTLEAMAQAIFKEWFVNFNFPGFDGELVDGLPKGWRIGKLGEVCEVQIGRTPPRMQTQWFSLDKNDVKWISIKDMGQSGVYIFSTSEYLTNEAIEKFRIPVIEKNTVIVSFKLTVGRLAITTEKMLSNEAIAQLKTEIIPEFLFLYLKNYNWGALGSTSSIATAVNSKSIKEIEILVADEVVLKEFEKVISPIFEKIKNNSIQIQTLTQTRDALLPKLMSGELEIKN